MHRKEDNSESKEENQTEQSQPRYTEQQKGIRTGPSSRTATAAVIAGANIVPLTAAAATSSSSKALLLCFVILSAIPIVPRA